MPNTKAKIPARAVKPTGTRRGRSATAAAIASPTAGNGNSIRLGLPVSFMAARVAASVSGAAAAKSSVDNSGRLPRSLTAANAAAWYSSSPGALAALTMPSIAQRHSFRLNIWAIDQPMSIQSSQDTTRTILKNWPVAAHLVGTTSTKNHPATNPSATTANVAVIEAAAARLSRRNAWETRAARQNSPGATKAAPANAAAVR